jgi:hypothetical protein
MVSSGGHARKMIRTGSKCNGNCHSSTSYSPQKPNDRAKRPFSPPSVRCLQMVRPPQATKRADRDLKAMAVCSRPKEPPSLPRTDCRSKASYARYTSSRARASRADRVACSGARRSSSSRTIRLIQLEKHRAAAKIETILAVTADMVRD